MYQLIFRCSFVGTLFFLVNSGGAMAADLQLFESGIFPVELENVLASAGKLSGRKKGAEKKDPNVAPRVVAKALFLAGDFEGCFKNMVGAPSKSPGLSAWYWRQKLICALPLLAGEKLKRAQFLELLDGVNGYPSEWSRPPYQESLRARWKDLYLAVMESAQYWPPQDRQRLADLGLRWKSVFSSSERAKVTRLMGEAYIAKQNYKMARQWMERALLIEDSSETRGRIDVIDRLTKDPGAEPVAQLGRSKKDLDSFGEELPKEKESYERAFLAMRQNDIMSVAEDLITILEVAPGGVRSKWATEKLQELYIQASEKEDSKFQLAKGKLLGVLKKADVNRLAKWVQVAFRAGQYADAYDLGQEVVGRSEVMTMPVKVLWLTARSAQFIGKADEARRLFGRVLQEHASSEEVLDGYLQLALMDLREEKFQAAVGNLEKILAKPRESSVELTARYWLWRALEKVDSARAQQEIKILIERFPLSYYGLRARLESSGGVLTTLGPESSATPAGENKKEVGKIPADIDRGIFSEYERESLNRAEILVKEGWIEEARLELSEVGEPRSVDARMWIAERAGQTADFLRASQVMNALWDEDLRNISDDSLRVVFPRFFLSGLEPEAKKYRLENLLPLSLMRQESGFNMRAVSSSGALGLMQMIPPTAKDTAKELNFKNLILPDDLFDPRTNMKFCVFYLSKVIQEFEGNIPAGLAAYNAGPTRLKKWMKSRKLALVPSSDAKEEMWFDELPWDETRFYVKAILRNLMIYRYLDRGRVTMNQPIWTPQ